MTNPIYHSFDADGYYTGSAEAPLDPVAGDWAQPSDTATAEPLPAYNPELERTRWQGGAWGVEVIPQPEPEPAPQPVPPQYPKLMSRDFLALFTRDEKLAVKAATRVSDELGLWYDEMLAAQYITAEDPATLAGLDALVAAALLTAERHDEILAAMQPVQIEN